MSLEKSKIFYFMTKIHVPRVALVSVVWFLLLGYEMWQFWAQNKTHFHIPIYVLHMYLVQQNTGCVIIMHEPPLTYINGCNQTTPKRCSRLRLVRLKTSQGNPYANCMTWHSNTFLPEKKFSQFGSKHQIYGDFFQLV